jgi:hypothetical protein
MPSSSNLPWKADFEPRSSGQEGWFKPTTVTVPTAQAIVVELAQKSPSMAIFVLGISACGKNAPKALCALL